MISYLYINTTLCVYIYSTTRGISDCDYFNYLILLYFISVHSCKKRKAYTVKEKLDAVNRVLEGEKLTGVGRDIGVPESTIRGWVRDRDKLQLFLESVDMQHGFHSKRTRPAKNPQLDAELYRWYIQNCDNSITPITNPIIKAHAEKLNNDFGGPSDFKASDGWLSLWRRRHGLCRLSTDAANISLEEDNDVKHVS